MKKKLIKVFTVFALVGSMCINVQATSISDLQEDKKDKESKKKEAESIVSQLEGEKNDLLTSIAELDAEIEEFNIQLMDLQAKKDDLDKQIETTKVELAEAQEEETKQYEALKRHIKYAYENGDEGYVDTVFSAGDVSDMVDRQEYDDQLYNYDSTMLIKLVKTKIKIADKQAQLESDLEAVKEVEAEVTDNMEATQVLADAKETQVANYTDTIEEQEEIIAAYQADIEALDANIAELEAQYRAAQAASGSPGPVYYTGGTFQWPVSSGGTITSYFGPRNSPTAGASSYHKGLDIGCATNTPILAGESGTVITAGYSSSMGNYVVIDHGDGVSTVYMHNNSLAVGSGQTVSRGQTIAYAGSTGISTGTHCHFSVRINGSYVDPLPYLQ